MKASEVIEIFKELSGLSWHPDLDLNAALENYLEMFEGRIPRNKKQLKKSLVYIQNERLQINKKIYRLLLNGFAKKGITFNYHQKLEIAYNLDDPASSVASLDFLNKNISPELEELVFKADENKNRNLLDLDIELKGEAKKDLVISSIFCSFVFYLYDEKVVHSALNHDCRTRYFASYWDHLKYHHKDQVDRTHGLTIFDADKILDVNAGEQEKVARLLSFVYKEYEALSNHCYMAITIGDAHKEKWSLISDVILYAEKFREYQIDKPYFRWRKVEEETCSYISDIDFIKAKFDLGNEGFSYKDTIITYDGDYERCVLLLEKNQRDERPIPCPACRTTCVQGNSYPVLGVRSWECTNSFCADKSKYNRGKRYSLSSIMRQQAILDDENIIPREILRSWRRDVVKNVSMTEVFEFLVRAFSLVNDSVNFYGTSDFSGEMFGRKILPNPKEITDKISGSSLQDLSFFNRFMISKSCNSKDFMEIETSIDGMKLYNGDAFDVLKSFSQNSFDGAVTSPPYYNARSYSTWPNIYCYLYDMFNVAEEVYRTLKPGAPYLFNIFDYFDNEKTIVFSDMGKKRLILSSYFSYIFRKIGFWHVGNIAWDKGEIEGSRSFNQGNFSPYYQAPLNCWEHVMIFSKGKPEFSVDKLPKHYPAKPVIKMVRGENRYGHTAPFPKAIPELLIRILSKGDRILDPFAGSNTTGRVAAENGLQSVGIELHKEYCELGVKLANSELGRNADAQIDMFISD